MFVGICLLACLDIDEIISLTFNFCFRWYHNIFFLNGWSIYSIIDYPRYDVLKQMIDWWCQEQINWWFLRRRHVCILFLLNLYWSWWLSFPSNCWVQLPSQIKCFLHVCHQLMFLMKNELTRCYWIASFYHLSSLKRRTKYIYRWVLKKQLILS